MSDSYDEDIAAHPAANMLFTVWVTADPVERDRLLAAQPPPGPIALRSRYRYLADGVRTGAAAPPPVPRSVWDTVLRAETEGDNALRRGRHEAADAVFTRLLTAAEQDPSGLGTVHARIGLADLAMYREDIDRAIAEYEAVLTAADAAGHRFGRLRALVPLGYLTLQHHSATTALNQFTEAHELADALRDPVYLGNAVLGAAECNERLGDLTTAAAEAEQAYSVFVSVGSGLGQGNAAQRLAAVLHRRNDIEKATEWFLLAAQAFEDEDNPMGTANVSSGIGDMLLDTGRFDEAEPMYERALRIAEAAGYPRSVAHALQDLARVARAREDWPTAEKRFRVAAAAYRELDDLIGLCHALDKLAEALGQLDRSEDVLTSRMEAVFTVEEYRATHQDERSQREYRARFRDVYSVALADAVRHDRPDVFAVVADGLAGRRLAGLMTADRAETPAGNTELLQDLVVRADQRLIRHRRGTAFESDEPARLRRIKLLGAVGIRHGLQAQVARSLDDVLASVYLPPADDGPELLAALPEGAHALQVTLDPANPGRLYWLWRTPGGRCSLGADTLSARAAELMTLLQGSGAARSDLKPDDLRPLGELVPQPLRAELVRTDGARLLVLPVGELWLVPWGAVPLSDELVLGQAVEYVVCPSLTIQRILTERPAIPASTPVAVDLWRSPFVDHHSLTELHEDPRWCVRHADTAREAKSRLLAGGEMAVVVAHGRLAPGVGHYVELDETDWLLPADLIHGHAPRLLVLVTCWGAGVPGQAMTDPVSLATLSLAGGSAEVLATVGEFGDSVVAEEYVKQVLDRIPDGSASRAVHEATRWLLGDAEARVERIRQWAPLIPMGTFTDITV